MDDFASDTERNNAKALQVLDDYEIAVTLLLSEEILKHEAAFRDKENPLTNSAPALLEKFHSIFYSLDTCKRALRKSCAKP